MSTSLIISLGDLHKFTDDNNRKTMFKIDSKTGSIVSINYSHHEIHDGNMYAFKAKAADLADAGEYKTSITIPTGTTFHLKEMDCWMNNAYGEIDLIESATASGGASVTVFNRYRGITATSGISVAQSATSTGGTTIDTITFGGGGANVASRSGGISSQSVEWVLKGGTTYVLNMKNLSGATATMSLRATGYTETE